MRFKLDKLHHIIRVIVVMSFLIPSNIVQAETRGQDNGSVEPSSTNEVNSNPIEVLTGSDIYVLKIDLDDPRVKPRVLLANNGSGGRQPLGSIKSQIESGNYEHWAVINGDYFSYDCPSNVNCAQGLTYIDGQLKDNWSEYGSTWQGRGNIGFDSGNSVEIQVGGHQPKRNMVVAGGPRVLMNGGSPVCQAVAYGDKTLFPDSNEWFDEDARRYCNSGLTLSAIGYSSDRRYLFMGVARGYSITAFAQWLKDRGAHEVLKLDGGGSSGIYYDGILRKGSTGRDIPNAFAVVVDPVAPNNPPNVPSLASPSNWHVQNDGRAPTLCWNNRGDPDGDNVEFKAEVYDSARNAESGWRSSTCWRPGDLDGHYHNYQWRVKARDSRGAESGWSETRHFSIEAPNLPPTISYNTSNGNGSGSIQSRDQNWTFQGTANDPENRLNRIEFHCRGDACNVDQQIGLSGNWSHVYNGLTGKNRVWFTACDEKQCRDSRTVTLYIDLAAPTTQADANGQANPSGWFREAVNVKLRAQDNGTGNAKVGVKEIRYRVDGGAWQSHSGSDKTVTVSTDGHHTVEYYALDNLNNQENTKSISFKLDRTPPSPPGGATETHGVANDQWQKSQNTPEFIWGASSDATSGLLHYELYFGPDAGGTAIQQFVDASAQRVWMPQPAGVRTGAYYLRGRTRDVAGNYSAWTTLFTFRYDITPPANPASADHAADVANDTWQRVTSTADFTWPPAVDEGSGIAGYHVYWGNDPNGTAGSYTTAPGYQSGGPLCAAYETCTGYLRVRSVDNVDIQAEDWSTVYALRYDGTPPTFDFSFSNGMTQTAQTLVTLSLDAVDTGSGVHAMRFSNDGTEWTQWEAYAPQRTWQIPAIGRQSWPIYAQVRDAVGNESPAVMHQIYLEVNRQQPRSAGYRLFDYAMSAGAGAHASSSYQGRSTVGEVMEPARVASVNYRLEGGYQAGSRAVPLVVPGHDEYTFINGIFASGVVAETMQSGSYQMIGTAGEPGLPNNATTITSGSYQLQPGFLAASPGATQLPPIPTPEPGPEPEPEPTPACEFPTVSIDGGAVFTGNPNVTLTICAPRAVEMQISNDGGFGGGQWEPYAQSKLWTLTTAGLHVVPRYVYVVFKDAGGAIHGTYLDDIIYDPTPPNGTLAVGDPVTALLPELMASGASVHAASSQALFKIGGATFAQAAGGQALDTPLAVLAAQDDETLDIFLIASDDNSGLAQMQLSETGDFGDAVWQPYDGVVQWLPSEGDGVKTLHARFQDSAGNVSDSAEASFLLDTEAPPAAIDIIEQIVSTNTVTVTVRLYAEDNLTGVEAMRISENPDFSDAPWQPFTPEIVWPVDIGDEDWDIILYAQFRDGAGNVSPTYSDAFVVDREGPLAFVEVAEGAGLERIVNVFGFDGLSSLGRMALTNDPLFIEDVVTMPYTETVTWTFDDRRVVWVQLEDSVGNLSEAVPAYAAADGAVIPLRDGWNLISSPVLPSTHTVPDVLNAIQGRYDRILGESGIYASELDPVYNSLSELRTVGSYYLRTTDPTLTAWQLDGTRTPVDTPMELHAGWNWIGYLPEISMPTEYALQSIAGKVQRVLGLEQVFDANFPTFNDLLEMTPGQGYLIYMTEPATLIYPVDPPLEASGGAVMHTSSGLCSNVSPTPNTTLLYGRILINGQAAPAGVRVQALTPDGAVAGCALTHGDGEFGLMHVYGADGDDTSGLAAATPGFRNGQAIRLRVAGVEIEGAPTPAWQDDRTPHRVDVSIDALDFFKAYLPAIVRGGEVETATAVKTAVEEGDVVADMAVDVMVEDEASAVDGKVTDLPDSQSYLPLIAPDQASQSAAPGTVPSPHDAESQTQ